MKALTICQPFASLIASGEKRVENRIWGTSYRGPLLIHAGKSREWLVRRPPDGMVFGAIIAVVDLLDTILKANITHPDVVRRYPWLPEHEHAHGPWCWVLGSVRAVEPPVPWRGALGLFDVPESAVGGTNAP